MNTTDQTTRVCKHHGEQSISEFYSRFRADKVIYACKLCAKEKNAKRSPEYMRNACKKYRATDKFKLNDKRYRSENKSRIKLTKKKSRDKCRIEVLQYYSQNEKPFCDCCQETNLEFLVLDHKFGKGNEHRRLVGGYKGANDAVYRWARKNQFPPLFRVLCHNCNFSYGTYGRCPHKTEILITESGRNGPASIGPDDSAVA